MPRSGVAPLYKGPVPGLNNGRLSLEQNGQVGLERLFLEQLGLECEHFSLFALLSLMTFLYCTHSIERFPRDMVWTCLFNQTMKAL